jgi:hypothetical protein
MESFRNFIYRKDWPVYCEMAYMQGNITRFTKLFDDDDLRFLHNFPLMIGKTPIWPQALAWRYSEGIMQAAEAREKDPNYAGGGMVKIDFDRIQKGKAIPTKYYFKVDPKNFELIQQLEKQNDPEQIKGTSIEDIHGGKFKGSVDYDVSRPLRAKDEFGKEIKDKWARHTVASFRTMDRTKNFARNTLRIWMAGTASGVLGPFREEFDGQETQVRKVHPLSQGGEFELPCIQKTVKWVEQIQGKPPKAVQDTVWLPVLNEGRLTNPISNYNLKEIFNLKEEQNIKNVYPSDVGGEEAVFKKLATPRNQGGLGLTQEKLQDAKEWLKAHPEASLKKLEDFLNYKHISEEKYRRIRMLRDFDKLSPERQKTLQTQYHTGHEAKAFHDPGSFELPQNYLIIGGWNPQKDQPVRVPCPEMSNEERQEILSRWLDFWRQCAQQGRFEFIRHAQDEGEHGKNLARQFRDLDNFDYMVAQDFISLNMCHPTKGLGETKEEAFNRGVQNGKFNIDNVDEKWLKKRATKWKNYAFDICKSLGQKDWGSGTRRLRQKMVALDAPLAAGEEGASSLGEMLSKKDIQKGMRGEYNLDELVKLLPKNQQQTLDFARHLEELRMDFVDKEKREGTLAQRITLAQAAFISQTIRRLYNEAYLKLIDSGLSQKEINKKAYEYVDEHLSNEVKEKGISGKSELIKQQLMNTEFSVGAGSAKSPLGLEEREYNEEMLEDLPETGLADFYTEPDSSEKQLIELEKIKNLETPEEKLKHLEALRSFLGKLFNYDEPLVNDESMSGKDLVQKVWGGIEDFVGVCLPEPEPVAEAEPEEEPEEAPKPTIPYDHIYNNLVKIHDKIVKKEPGVLEKLQAGKDQLMKIAQLLGEHPDQEKRNKAMEMLKEIGQFMKAAPTTPSGPVLASYEPYYANLENIYKSVINNVPGTLFKLKTGLKHYAKLVQSLASHPDPEKRKKILQMRDTIEKFMKSKNIDPTQALAAELSEMAGTGVVMGSGPYKKWKHKDFNAWGAAGDPMGVSPSEDPIGTGKDKKKKKKKKKKPKDKLKEHIEKLKLKPYRERLEQRVKDELGEIFSESNKDSD